jgi:hypothetical protein
MCRLLLRTRFVAIAGFSAVPADPLVSQHARILLATEADLALGAYVGRFVFFPVDPNAFGNTHGITVVARSAVFKRHVFIRGRLANTDMRRRTRTEVAPDMFPFDLDRHNISFTTYYCSTHWQVIFRWHGKAVPRVRIASFARLSRDLLASARYQFPVSRSWPAALSQFQCETANSVS